MFQELKRGEGLGGGRGLRLNCGRIKTLRDILGLERLAKDQAGLVTEDREKYKATGVLVNSFEPREKEKT